MRLRMFVVRRLYQTAVTMMVVMTLLFVLFRLMPGDPARIVLGQNASPEEIERQRELWGLDKPLYIQYLTYMKNLGLPLVLILLGAAFGIQFLPEVHQRFVRPQVNKLRGTPAG